MNIFKFDKKLYIQLIGIAMGTRSAPTIANISMAFIDTLIKNLAINNGMKCNIVSLSGHY